MAKTMVATIMGMCIHQDFKDLRGRTSEIWDVSLGTSHGCNLTPAQVTPWQSRLSGSAREFCIVGTRIEEGFDKSISQLPGLAPDTL